VQSGSHEYLTFRLARRDLAVDASRVRGVLPLSELKSVPHLRPGILGVVNFSGRPVVVIDFRIRLHLTAESQGAQQRIVVVETASGRFAGFVADRVADVISYRSRDVHDGALHGSGRRRLLVDLDQVVSEDDLVRLWS
jgi:chemotaxis signal transduction protein